MKLSAARSYERTVVCHSDQNRSYAWTNAVAIRDARAGPQSKFNITVATPCSSTNTRRFSHRSSTMTYSANNNQNYFVQQGRTTSRVLNRPGGSCSLSLGGWTEEELERQRQLRQGGSAAAPPEATGTDTSNQDKAKAQATTTASKAKENITNSVQDVVAVDESFKPNETSDAGCVAAPAAAQNAVAPPGTLPPARPTVSSNAFASSSTTNSFNVLTDRPTSRVSRPPGGHSSIRLG